MSEAEMHEPAGNEPGWRANPGGLIYGVLAIASVVAAESTRRETFPKLLGASAITLVLYWVAHAYSHHWGSRLRHPQPWTVRDIAAALAQESPILAGAAVPAAALIVAWVSGASKEAGVTVVLWSSVIEIVALEVIIGIRSRLSAADTAVQGLVGVLLGVGIAGLRILLH